MKNITIFLAIICYATSVYAQEHNGRIIDANTREPLAFANVVALAADSTMIQGTTSADDGSFSIVANGATMLYISYIGYTPQFLTLASWSGGDVLLQPSASSIGEVKISASRPTFKMERGSLITEVQGSFLSSMGQATDVLGQLPLVRSTDEGSISVVGRGTPLIYINNRKMQSRNELSTLSASNIKNITVINNPGPEYGSVVKSVIKIETIKPTGEGFSGQIGAFAKKNNAFSWNTYGSLNYRRGNLDIFGSIDFSNANRKQHMFLERSIAGDTATYSNSDSSDFTRRSQFLDGNVGINYTPNKHTSMGLRYSYDLMPREDKYTASLLQLSSNGALMPGSDISSNDMHSEQRAAHHVNAYYNGAIEEMIAWNFNADMLVGNSHSTQEVVNEYANSLISEKINTTSRQSYDLASARLVLTAPLGPGDLMGGGELAHTNNRQQFTVELDTTGASPLSGNNNHARQTQWAAFVGYNLYLGEHMDLELGLRYEDTQFDYIVKGQEPTHQRDKGWLPMVGINFYNDALYASLSYKRVVDRPSYYQLRNSTQYNSPYSYEAGNPYLLPTTDNLLSAMLQLKEQKLLITADYYQAKNAAMLVSKPLDERTSLTRFENFDRFRSVSIALNYAPRIGFWRPNIDLGWSKDLFTHKGQSFSCPVFEASTRSVFTVSKLLLLGLTFGYTSSGHTQLDLVESHIDLGTHITARLLHEQLQITLRGSNLLNSRHKYTRTMYGITTHLLNHMNGRGVSLSVSYRFNTTKSRYKGEDSSEEINRL